MTIDYLFQYLGGAKDVYSTEVLKETLESEIKEKLNSLENLNGVKIETVTFKFDYEKAHANSMYKLSTSAIGHGINYNHVEESKTPLTIVNKSCDELLRYVRSHNESKHN